MAFPTEDISNGHAYSRHYMKQKFQEWKAKDQLFRPQLSWMPFGVVIRVILPILHEARTILEAE